MTANAAMSDIARTSFSFPAIRSKKVTGCFDGGAITSDAGVLLLAQAERRLGIVDRLVGVIPDGRDPSRVTHRMCDILRARAMAIACGYEDGDDLDELRHDPAFMMALGKAPGEDVGLVSQPTMSRFENGVGQRSLIRVGREMVDIFCSSYDAPPESVTLDIDDTFDAAHGQQQLTLFNGYHGERGYAPIHVYEAQSEKPVAFILRPARTPSGVEARGHVRRLIRRIRSHWPQTRITLRGDGHYGRPEVMAWCEAQAGVDFIFGLPANSALRRDPVVTRAQDACAVQRAKEGLLVLRCFCETQYAAASWGETRRRVIARFEARQAHGMAVRYIVTSLADGTPEQLYERVYCARGQMENLIKLHKTQLKSDRTSCSSATANQMRLILHTIAYWMIWAVRSAMPKAAGLKRSDFETIQRRLLKIGARVIETQSRIRVAFASACPDKALFITILDTLLGRQASHAQAP